VPDLHAFTVAVALSAADACLDVAGVDPGLKWPNDLVVDDLKLAGVLAEAVGVGGADPDEPAVVVGLGLNVGWPGPGSDAAADELGATSLHRLLHKPSGARPDCDLLLERVLEHLAGRISGLLQPLGRVRLVDEYRTRCATLGRQVTVEEHSGSFTGRACGISDEGHLLVDTASGRRTVTAGDVVHIRHPPGGPVLSPRSRPHAAPPDMDPGPAS
jgi:BirA family biotin operon repressor/biotin-[acetyl-CoA-carboxylase] ligase